MIGLLISSLRSFVVTLGERRLEKCRTGKEPDSLSYPWFHALVSGPCAWSPLNDSSGSESPFDLTFREVVSLHFPKTDCGKNVHVCVFVWTYPMMNLARWVIDAAGLAYACVLSLNYGKSLWVEGFLAHTCTLLFFMWRLYVSWCMWASWSSPLLLRVKSHTESCSYVCCLLYSLNTSYSALPTGNTVMYVHMHDFCYVALEDFINYAWVAVKFSCFCINKLNKLMFKMFKSLFWSSYYKFPI